MAVAELIKNVMGEIEKVMQTRTVVGDPISAGEFIVIPVSKVSFGFGAGGGGSEEKSKGGSGEGVGGGWSIEPMAFFVVGEEGARLYSIRHEESVVGRLIDMAPKVAEKVKDFVEKKGESRSEESSSD
ncbi:MAG: spore germination protein GerW family protein [Candidatus Neomarinimicrobiota bacterium]